MKFDVIVGNPPYQKTPDMDHPSQELWPLFVEKAIKYLASDGILSFITPASWFKASANIQRKKEEGGNINILNDIFKKGTLIYVDLNSVQKRGYFSNIGSHITYWVYLKEKTHNCTEFVYWDGGLRNFKYNISTMNSIPFSGYPFSITILEKVKQKEGIKWSFNHHRKEILNDINDHQSDEYKYPIAISTAAKKEINNNYGLVIKWSKIKQSFYEKPKVVIPYLSPSGFEPVITTKPVGSNYCAIILLNNSEIESAKSIFKSKLYRMFFTLKNGQHTEVAPLNAWTAMPLTKIYSDTEVYAFYCLTEEEIAYIEETIK